MTPEARAESMRLFICECTRPDCPRVARVASAVREAENEATERASRELTDLAYRNGTGWPSSCLLWCAETILRLKHPETR